GDAGLGGDPNALGEQRQVEPVAGPPHELDLNGGGRVEPLELEGDGHPVLLSGTGRKPSIFPGRPAAPTHRAPGTDESPPTSSFVSVSVTASVSTRATAPIGIVTSRLPHRWPRSRTKWVMASSLSTRNPSTWPRCRPSAEVTSLARRISTSPLGMRSYGGETWGSGSIGAVSYP